MDQYVPLIKKTAKSLLWKQYGLARNMGLEIGDYESLATIGFMKAMRNFRRAKCTSVKKYTFNYMRQEVRKAIDKMLKNYNKTAAMPVGIASPEKYQWPIRSECMGLAGIIRSFNGSLTDNETSVLRLSYYDNLSPFMIAKKLNVPIKTVEIRLRNAHRKIKAGIVEFGPISKKNGQAMDDIEIGLINVRAKSFVQSQTTAARSRNRD